VITGTSELGQSKLQNAGILFKVLLVFSVFLEAWGELGLRANVPPSLSNWDLMYIPFHPQPGETG
jgi:hypothetical protein